MGSIHSHYDNDDARNARPTSPTGSAKLSSLAGDRAQLLKCVYWGELLSHLEMNKNARY